MQTFSVKRRPSSVRPTLLLLVALLVPATSGAQALLTARVGGTTNTSPSGVAQTSDATPFGTHASTAYYGYLVAGSSVSLPDVGSDSGLTTVASFQDDITITDPSAVGVGGTLRALVRVVGGPDYDASASGPGVTQGMNTSYQVLTIRNGGTANFLDGGILYSTGQAPPETISGTVPAPGLVEVEFLFSFGFPVNFGMSLSAQTGGNNNFFPPDFGSISGESDVFLAWEGITSIRDSADNELIGTAQIVSASGTDWRAPQRPPPTVPVGGWVAPGAGLLLMLTALGWQGVRRRA